MNLNSFSYVIEIERCGSINRAAQNLYISQSNLSSAIKALEDELGYHIFSRTSKGITPTAEGYLFIQAAKAITMELDKIYNIPSLTGFSADISLSCTWSSQFYCSFMNFKAKNYPEIRDSYKETGLIQNFQDVQENRYRLALFYCFHSRTAYHQEEARKTNLTAELIVENLPVVALMSIRHPLAERPSLSLNDIHSYPLVLFEDFENEDWQNILHISPSQRVLYVFDRGGIEDSCLQSDYISIIKKSSVTMFPASSLVEIPIYDLADSLDVLLLRHKTYTLNRREKAFIRQFKKDITP